MENTRIFKNTHGFNVFITISELQELIEPDDLPMPNLPEDNSFYDLRAAQIINEIYNK